MKLRDKEKKSLEALKLKDEALLNKDAELEMLRKMLANKSKAPVLVLASAITPSASPVPGPSGFHNKNNKHIIFGDCLGFQDFSQTLMEPD
jgi:hypothetical protein